MVHNKDSLNTHIKKLEMLQINNLMMYFRNLN